MAPGKPAPGEIPSAEQRSKYYGYLCLLWCLRLAAWVLGAYLVKVGLSVDSLKMYAAISVLLSIVLNVLPDARGPRPPAGAEPRSRFPARQTHPAYTAAASRSSRQLARGGTASAEPIEDSNARAAPRLSLVERARLGQLMRALGTPGAIRCVNDESFRVFMITQGHTLAPLDACPCGSGESFERCCYAVPATLVEWMETVSVQ